MQFDHSISLIVISVVVIILLATLFILFFKAKSRATSSGDRNEQIYIGNLPYRTSERDLNKCFSRYGRIMDIRIVKDHRTGRSKGYAFIKFSNAREAKKSLAEHGKDFAGRSLVVHFAKPR